MKEGLETRIARARERFRSRARITADEISRLLSQGLQTASRTELDALLDRLHQLAGSAGSFGFPDIGNAALQFEAELDAALGGGAPASCDTATKLIDRIDALDCAAAS